MILALKCYMYSVCLFEMPKPRVKNTLWASPYECWLQNDKTLIPFYKCCIVKF